MTKGKPWTVDEETALKDMMEANTPLEVMATKLNKKPDTIYVKCVRLGLKKKLATSSGIPLPKDLPSVEETLKKLAAALEIACIPGLDRYEVQRLQVVSTLSKTYKEILVDYMNYREIEAKLNDMETKYDALLKKTSQDNAPKPVPAQMEESSESRTINQPS
jgi:hypothetical protein